MKHLLNTKFLFSKPTTAAKREQAKEHLQTVLMTLRKSGDYDLDARLYSLIREVGKL